MGSPEDYKSSLDLLSSITCKQLSSPSPLPRPTCPRSLPPRPYSYLSTPTSSKQTMAPKYERTQITKETTMEALARVVAQFEEEADHSLGIQYATILPVYRDRLPREVGRFFPRHAAVPLPFEVEFFSWNRWNKSSLATWPTPLEKWNHWVARLAPTYQSVWRSTGIDAFIQLTLLEFRYDPAMLPAAVAHWNRCYNFFHFRSGPMSIYLLDVVAITCLPVSGEQFSPIAFLPSSFGYDAANVRPSVTFSSS